MYTLFGSVDHFTGFSILKLVVENEMTLRQLTKPVIWTGKKFEQLCWRKEMEPMKMSKEMIIESLGHPYFTFFDILKRVIRYPLCAYIQ
jgi:hypothetical protein